MPKLVDDSGNLINYDCPIVISNSLNVKPTIFASSNPSVLYANDANIYSETIKLIIQANSKNNAQSPLDLSYFNFQGMNLSELNMSHFNLTGANFAGANLTKANLSHCNLTGANFSSAILRYANISRANITGITGINAICTNLISTSTSGTPLVPFGGTLSKGIVFNSYNGYFYDDINYCSTPKKGLAGDSSGVVFDMSNLFVSTNKNFIDNVQQLEYTIKWNGFFYAKFTGTYEFSLKSDDGSYFWINVSPNLRTTENATIDNSSQHPAVTKTQKVLLLAGCYYPMCIIFGQNLGDHTCCFTFTNPTNNSINNCNNNPNTCSNNKCVCNACQQNKQIGCNNKCGNNNVDPDMMCWYYHSK